MTKEKGKDASWEYREISKTDVLTIIIIIIKYYYRKDRNTFFISDKTISVNSSK